MPPRDRCYDCFRPTEHCLCRWIEPVDNRTGIVVLQHPKERGHAFNTARLAKLGLRRSELVVGYVPELAARADVTALVQGAGLLYPGPGARDLSELGPGERPDRLVVLDGTWWHARTMMRDVVALHDLPRFTLPGGLVSGFKVRQQPYEFCLSTIEAITEALRCLEPDTAGLDGLLRPFEEMQRLHLQTTTEATPRTRVRPRPKRRKLPAALTAGDDSLVVAYIEIDPHVERGEGRELLAVAACRPGSGARWSCVIEGQQALASEWPQMRLDRGPTLPLGEARAAWLDFLRPGDTVAAWNGSTLGRIDRRLGGLGEVLELRPVYRAWRGHRGDLDAIVRAEGLRGGSPDAPPVTRAVERCENAARVVGLLRGLDVSEGA